MLEHFKLHQFKMQNANPNKHLHTRTAFGIYILPTNRSHVRLSIAFDSLTLFLHTREQYKFTTKSIVIQTTVALAESLLKHVTACLVKAHIFKLIQTS